MGRSDSCAKLSKDKIESNFNRESNKTINN
jgi:hypothetical protein